MGVKPAITITLLVNLSAKPDVQHHRTASFPVYAHREIGYSAVITLFVGEKKQRTLTFKVWNQEKKCSLTFQNRRWLSHLLESTLTFRKLHTEKDLFKSSVTVQLWHQQDDLFAGAFFSAFSIYWTVQRLPAVTSEAAGIFEESWTFGCEDSKPPYRFWISHSA